jgi:hypothetical protein
VKSFVANAVAVACRFFESRAGDDGDLAATVADEASLLEGAGDECDGGAASAQHVGHEFLGHDHGVLIGAVAGHEEPASEALFGLVKFIAGGDLLECNVLLLNEFEDAVAQLAGGEEHGPEVIESHAEGGALHLDEGLGGGRGGAEQLHGADESFAADEADLGATSFCHGDDDGSYARIEEVNVHGNLTLLMQEGTHGQIDRAREAQDRLTKLRRQGVEQ